MNTALVASLLLLLSIKHVSGGCAWNFVNGIPKCFRYFSQERSFSDANYTCANTADGASLAMPKTEEISDFIETILPANSDNIWIGLLWLSEFGINYNGIFEDDFKWLDGTPVTEGFQNWGIANSYNENVPCVGVRLRKSFGHRVWWDKDCSFNQFSYICEVPYTSCPCCLSPSQGNRTTFNPVFSRYDVGDTVTYACESPEEGLVEGDLERTCMGAFNWSGLEPVCGGCPIPASDTNYTTLVRNQSFIHTYPVGYTVTYACADSRLVHVAGDLTRTCLTDLTWSGLQPRCDGCLFPPHGNHSIHDLIDNGDPFAVGDIVSYQCLPGLLPIDGDTIRTCLADRTWSGTPLSCSGCSPPANDTQFLSLYEPVKEEYQLNETISYSCIGSYISIQGEITRTCDSNLEWTGNGSLQCAGCPPPENATLATYSALNVTYYEIGYLVEYTCLDGFVWVEGDLNLTCMPSLNWDGTTPTCKGCDAPENGTLAKPSVLGSVFGVGETAHYACTDGFFLFSGDINRTCLDSLTWSGVAPECRGCTVPEIGYLSNYSLSEGPYFPLGKVVNYTCHDGFQVKNGSRNRTCIMANGFEGSNCSCINLSNGYEKEFCPIDYTNQTICRAGRAVWSGTPLQCGGCKKLFNSSRFVIMPQKNTYRIGESVNYTCNPGLRHTRGDLTRYCQENLTWSGRTPSCAGCSAPDDADTRATYSPALEPRHMYRINKTITYSCDQNFVKVNGNDLRTCQFDLTWSGHPMRCGGCGLPELGTNSTHSFAQYNETSQFGIGTVVIYECLTGHEKIDGDWNRTCLGTLNWSGGALSCSVPESTTGPSTNVTITTTRSDSDSLCDEPPIIPHTKGTLVDNDIGTAPTERVAIFRCDVGYWFQENRIYEQHVTCLHWNTISPCTAVQCPPPLQSGSAILLRQTQGQYVFNSTVEYRCPNGTYLPDGKRSRFSRCTQRGVWSAYPPACTASVPRVTRRQRKFSAIPKEASLSVVVPCGTLAIGLLLGISIILFVLDARTLLVQIQKGLRNVQRFCGRYKGLRRRQSSAYISRG